MDGACPPLELPAYIFYISTVCLTFVLVIRISHRRVYQSWSTTFDRFTAGVAILSPLSLIRFFLEDRTQKNKDSGIKTYGSYHTFAWSVLLWHYLH